MCSFEVNLKLGMFFFSQGMFGATLEDLSPEMYGYLTLEGLLKAHFELLKLTHLADGTVWCSNPLALPIDQDTQLYDRVRN